MFRSPGRRFTSLLRRKSHDELPRSTGRTLPLWYVPSRHSILGKPTDTLLNIQDLWEISSEIGLLDIAVSSEHGSLHQRYFQHTLAMEELSQSSSSVALSYGAHSSLCVNQIHRRGTAEHNAKYLPGLISGKKVGSLAMSEPGNGTDVFSMKPKAERIDGGWKLCGNEF